MPATIETPPLSLDQYIEAVTVRYTSCLDSLQPEPANGGISATVRFQHLKFDTKTGTPMFRELAAALADHLVMYCFSLRRRGNIGRPDRAHKLHREARELLRRHRTSGEAGEILIYFLLEAVLRAPQLVAKMDLKTNRRVEGLGSDGIHMKWDQTDKALDVYFAEAKLEQSVSNAISHAVKSLRDFHSERQFEHELRLVTGHYKQADDETKQAVLRILDGEEEGTSCRLNHACLIGYDWKNYQMLPDLIPQELSKHFRQSYFTDRTRLHKLVERHFSGFPQKTLSFEIFFLPFASVQEFRDAFDAAV
jgi:hypothetical protein